VDVIVHYNDSSPKEGQWSSPELRTSGEDETPLTPGRQPRPTDTCHSLARYTLAIRLGGLSAFSLGEQTISGCMRIIMDRSLARTIITHQLQVNVPLEKC
jgi:hypothetical protein